MECRVHDDLVLRRDPDPFREQAERITETRLERSEMMDAAEVERPARGPRDAAACRQ